MRFPGVLQVAFLFELGVDGLVALNTQKDYEAFSLPEADRQLLTHYTAKYGGGLSGPPMLERSTAQAAAAQRAVRARGGRSNEHASCTCTCIPSCPFACAWRPTWQVDELRLGGKFTVVHVGGIESAADVQASRQTGCELRQWYTGLMHGLAQSEPWSLYARVTK